MTKPERITVGKMQTKIGRAIGIACNDRAPDRMDKLLPLLEDAHNTCIALLGKYPPQDANPL